MAAKKKKGSKKKSSNAADSTEGMDISLPEDKIKYLEGKHQSLQYQLAQRSSMMFDIDTKYNNMKDQWKEMSHKLEQQSDTTMALTKDMTRQYKGMQEDLLDKITKRDGMIQQLTDAWNVEKEDHLKAMEEKDCVIQEKEECIGRLERKMEEQCRDFAKMLECALEQMRERIEVQSVNYDEKSVPIHHRLEEFTFHPSVGVVGSSCCTSTSSSLGVQLPLK